VKTMKYGPVLALALLAFLATSPVHADTMYTYTGTPFTTCFGTYTCTSTGPLISIKFDTTTPLAANLPFTDITNNVIMSFGMSDGTGFGLGGADNAGVAVGTDANGNINQWSIGGFSDCLPGCVGIQAGSSYMAGQSYDYSELWEADTLVGGGETRSGPGTWTVTTPEPRTLILLGAGLLGLALIGLRR
jgi:hypothetical protein